MKKLQLLVIICMITATAMAQVPDIMNYQAVARNNSGQALASQTIRVRLSIMKNAVLQYSETRVVTTNTLGLFNIQIGSAGALSTTGSFGAINWQNNAAPGYVLKVELDITNSGVFTDMGSQPLVTVPYAFATKKADQATETVNLAGRPLNTTDAPAPGSKLMWDGTTWSPVRDTIINFNSPPGGTISEGGGTAPWVFAGGEKVITVNGNETIFGSLNCGVTCNTVSTTIPISTDLCYQLLPAGPITPFQGNTFQGTTFHSYSLYVNNQSFFHLLPASGASKLPAGQYKIGFGIKNRSSVQAQIIPNTLAGYIQIKE